MSKEDEGGQEEEGDMADQDDPFYLMETEEEDEEEDYVPSLPTAKNMRAGGHAQCHFRWATKVGPTRLSITNQPGGVLNQLVLSWAGKSTSCTSEAHFNREYEIRILGLQKRSVAWKFGQPTDFGCRESGCASSTTSAQLSVLDVESRSKAMLLSSETAWAGWYAHFRNTKLGCFQRQVKSLLGEGAGTKGSGHCSFLRYYKVKDGWDVAVELTVDELTVAQSYAKEFAGFWASIAQQGLEIRLVIHKKTGIWLKAMQMRECA